MKYVVILGDGMADWPIASLNEKTPLEVAHIENIDKIAKESLVGLCKTIPDGMKPGSDNANLSVMGFDPLKFYSGRSPLEAASIGIDLKPDDVTYRANLVCLAGEDEYENLTMADYSAGEITTKEAQELINCLKKYFDSDELKLYNGVSYRHCLVRSKGELGTEFTPPHDISDKLITDFLPKGKYGEEMLTMMKKSYEILKSHPINLERVKNGKNPANSLWFWGEGRKPALQSFEKKYGLKSAVISAVDLIKGIGICAGMDVIEVPGATGNYDTNFEGKAQAAIEALKGKYDFVYIHMEAPDECGHHGDLKHKIESIEKIDKLVVKPIIEAFPDINMLIMPDHPTPIAIKTHCSQAVPFVMKRSGVKVKGTVYDEKHAKSTGVYIEKGYTLMDKFIKG